MILVLTGAGISAESGLSTFRDKNGIWKQASADLATPEAFGNDPETVLAFYNERRAKLLKVEPNAAHRALVELERAAAGAIITQNVDNLHERAGARKAIHMHGRLMQNLCAGCDHRWPEDGPITKDSRCPACDGGVVRPDVVWFGEQAYEMDRIFELFQQVKTFVAIGTSAAVYPAAGFVEGAQKVGARTVEINLKPSERSADFDEQIIGPATETVPQWIATELGAMRMRSG